MLRLRHAHDTAPHRTRVSTSVPMFVRRCRGIALSCDRWQPEPSGTPGGLLSRPSEGAAAGASQALSDHNTKEVM